MYICGSRAHVRMCVRMFTLLCMVGNLASECEAYGPGLVEGIVNENSDFSVLVPKVLARLSERGLGVLAPLSEGWVC